MLIYPCRRGRRFPPRRPRFLRGLVESDLSAKGPSIPSMTAWVKAAIASEPPCPQGDGWPAPAKTAPISFAASAAWRRTVARSSVL